MNDQDLQCVFGVICRAIPFLRFPFCCDSFIKCERGRVSNTQTRLLERIAIPSRFQWTSTRRIKDVYLTIWILSIYVCLEEIISIRSKRVYDAWSLFVVGRAASFISATPQYHPPPHQTDYLTHSWSDGASRDNAAAGSLYLMKPYFCCWICF